MVDLCKSRYAEDVEVGDELDLDGDEYGDNEFAAIQYASVLSYNHIYKQNDPWVLINTSQGEFLFPAGHMLKVKVIE